MKDFLLIFRNDPSNHQDQTAEERQVIDQQWMTWMTGIAAQNKLTDRGNRLADSGRVVKSKDIITNGPYTEIKETIGGYTMVKTDSYDDAVELARTCPILEAGGNVEVREVWVMLNY